MEIFNAIPRRKHAKVDVNIADKKVTVDSVASAQDIEAALAEDGYPARVIEQV